MIVSLVYKDSSTIEVVTMEDKKSQLVKLILSDNISAIVTMGEKLNIDPEDVTLLINELLSAGELLGTISKDGSRFFKTNVRVSEAPVIPRDEELPKFLSYNTKPGKVISVIGFLVLVGGLTINAIARDLTEQNFAAILIFIGLLVFLIGLYMIAKRGTPD